MADNERIHVRLDTYTRVCLGAITVLLTVLIVGLWAQMPLAGTAGAADTTFAPSLTSYKAQEITNAKLDELIALLKDGSVKVQVVGEARDAGGGNATTSKSAK